MPSLIDILLDQPMLARLPPTFTTKFKFVKYKKSFTNCFNEIHLTRINWGTNLKYKLVLADYMGNFQNRGSYSVHGPHLLAKIQFKDFSRTFKVPFQYTSIVFKDLRTGKVSPLL